MIFRFKALRAALFVGAAFIVQAASSFGADPAEALGYHGESEAGVTTLAELVKSKQPYEALAALNTLEYMWKAGHVPLARVQNIVRELKLSEPADRIPRYLLSLK